MQVYLNQDLVLLNEHYNLVNNHFLYYYYLFLVHSLDGTWKTISAVNEQDDHIEIDGEIFHKPFVEKPISAENHDVYIYFPLSAGGGSQRLFRKVLEVT